MSIFSNPYTRSRRTMFYAWLPAFIAVLAICLESTNGMGLAHTNAMLASVVRWTGHRPTEVDPFNRFLRKMGHFTGYGLLGICFARGWLMFLRRRASLLWKTAYLRAGLRGVASACLVASCDEFHQSFLPSRQASLHDVFLDTCGALTLIAASGLFALRRQAMAKLRLAHSRQDGYTLRGAESAFGTS